MNDNAQPCGLVRSGEEPVEWSQDKAGSCKFTMYSSSAVGKNHRCIEACSDG